MTFHETDTTGQAIEHARRAAAIAVDALGDLVTELLAERELHRAEVARLVERAEAAEHEVRCLRREPLSVVRDDRTRALDKIRTVRQLCQTAQAGGRVGVLKAAVVLDALGEST